MNNPVLKMNAAFALSSFLLTPHPYFAEPLFCRARDGWAWLVLLQRSPNAVHIVVVFERLQELTDFGALFVTEFWEVLSHIPQLTGDDSPAV